MDSHAYLELKEIEFRDSYEFHWIEIIQSIDYYNTEKKSSIFLAVSVIYILHIWVEENVTSTCILKANKSVRSWKGVEITKTNDWRGCAVSLKEVI